MSKQNNNEMHNQFNHFKKRQKTHSYKNEKKMLKNVEAKFKQNFSPYTVPKNKLNVPLFVKTIRQCHRL